MAKRLLSIVVPVFNEVDGLDELYARIREHADHVEGDWELVLVDDGSTDGSTEKIDQIVAGDARVRLIQLSRNFGQQVAICAGLDAVRGDLIMLMDADLQDPPEAIPSFVDAICSRNHDLVFGIREGRADRWTTRLMSAVFWLMIRKLSGFDIPENLAVMRIFNRRFLEEFQRFPERQKFIEGIFMWIGLRRSTLAIPHRARFAGHSKYNFLRKIQLATTATTAFSDRPLTAAIGVGASLAVLGLGFFAFIALRKLIFDYYAQGWVSTFGIVLVAGGIQLIFLGVLGKYIGRVFNEAKQRPLYIVQKRSGEPALRALSEPKTKGEREAS